MFLTKKNSNLNKKNINKYIKISKTLIPFVQSPPLKIGGTSVV